MSNETPDTYELRYEIHKIGRALANEAIDKKYGSESCTVVDHIIEKIDGLGLGRLHRSIFYYSWGNACVAAKVNRETVLKGLKDGNSF